MTTLQNQFPIVSQRAQELADYINNLPINNEYKSGLMHQVETLFNVERNRIHDTMAQHLKELYPDEEIV